MGKANYKYRRDATGRNKIAEGVVEAKDGQIVTICIPEKITQYRVEWVSLLRGVEGGLRMLVELRLSAPELYLLLFIFEHIGFDNEAQFCADLVAQELQLSRAIIYRAKKRLLRLNVFLKSKRRGYIKINPRIGFRNNIEVGQAMIKTSPPLRSDLRLVPAP